MENGKYYKVEPHTKELSDKPSLTPLSTYEEIQSNEFITLECENNHKIQVMGKAVEIEFRILLLAFASFPCRELLNCAVLMEVGR